MRRSQASLRAFGPLIRPWRDYPKVAASDSQLTVLIG